MDLYKIRSLLINGKTIFDVPLRVVYYARVSTDKDEQLNSLKNQVQYYEEYINKNKNWILVDKYIDEGISATTTKGRISFLKMIDDAKLDQFDLIITKEISRFSRNTLDSLKYTQNLLQSGVGVYFEYDDINTLEPDSELRLTIMSSIAQEEVRKLSERVKFGQKRAMKNGILFGRNNLFGYNKVGNDLCIKEDEAVIVRQIFNTYVEGKLGLRRIARDLEKQGIVDSKGKMISYGSLHHMITNPKYKGFYCGRKTSTEDYRYKKTIRINKEDWIVYKDM